MEEDLKEKITKAKKIASNELYKLAERLLEPYGEEEHWEISKAEKTENGWNLTVRLIAGEENESNE